MTLYNVKSADGQYYISKFDDDANIIDGSQYFVSLTECTCPAGHLNSCRHRRMLPMFIAMDAVDSPKFLHFESDQWVEPFEELEDEEDTENEIDLGDDPPPVESLAGEGPGPSTFAANLSPSPSQESSPSPDLRGEPAPIKRRF